MSHGGFSRTSARRKAMFENLAAALIKHEQIRTTLPKAKDLRPVVERLITRGKHGGLHARGQMIATLQSAPMGEKMLRTLAQSFAARERGYTPILKGGCPFRDNGAMAGLGTVDPRPPPKGQD